MSRRLYIVSGMIGGLVALPVLIVALALYSPRVATWTAAQLPAWTDGQVSVDRVEGRLAGPLQVHGLVYTQEDGTRVSVEELNLRWRPRGLWLSRIDVQHLSLRGVQVALPAADDERPAQAVALPEISLPGHLRVVRLEIHTASLVRDGEPVGELDRLTATLQLDGARLGITGLAAETPDFDLRGDLGVEMAGDWPLTADLHWQVPAMPGGTLQTRSRLRGDLARLRLHQTVTAPFTGELRATLEDGLNTRRWEARLDFDGLAVPLPGDGKGMARFSGHGQGVGTEGRFSGEGALDAEGVEAPLLLDLAVGFSDQRLTIERLRASLEDEDGFIEATGTVDLAASGGPAGDLALAWQDLHWPGLPAWTMVAGEATLSGSPAQYALALDGTVAAPDARGGTQTVTLAGRASGDEAHIVVRELRLTAGEGVLEGEGRADWRDGLAWEGQARVRDMDPAWLAPDWPGRVSLDATTTGEDREHLTLAFDNLHGELRGQPLAGRGRLRRDGARFEVDDLELAAGEARLSLAGEMGAEETTGRITLRVPDLAALMPDSTGNATLTVNVYGPRARPLVRFRGRGRDLEYGPGRIGAVDFSGVLDLADEQASRLDLSATALWFEERGLRELTLEAGGYQHEHTLSLGLRNDQARLDLELAGALELGQPGWSGAVTALAVGLPNDNRWQLDGEPVALRAGGEAGARLDRLCLGQGSGSRLCAGGSYEPGGEWRADLMLTGLDLANLQPFLAPGLESRGELSGELRLAGVGRELRTVAVTADSDHGELVNVATVEGVPEEQLLRYRQASLRMGLDETGLEGRLEAGIGAQGRLDLEAAFPDWDRRLDSLVNTAFTARLRGQTRELEALSLLFPDVDRLGGELDMDMRLDGTLASPGMAGHVRVTDGYLDILPGGLSIDAVQAEARGSGSRELDILLSARSGGGELGAEGRLAWEAASPYLQLDISGEAFQVFNTAEARVWVSPSLALVLEDGTLAIEGAVEVPRARLRPVDFTSTVRPTEDLVVVNRVEQAPEPALDISARVRITLGEAVDFSGFGLKGRLAGNLVVIERPGETTTASGNLEIVDGIYEAYGQELAINPGRLVYTGGPVADPGLDIRAQREVREVRVGLNVRGTLKSPEVTLFSEPPMTQQNTLSYLLLGRPINQTSGEDGALLAQAALALGLSGGERLAQSIGGRFGIDEVGVEAEQDSNDAQLVLGTYLSPRLFVSYGIGLFEAGNTARVRYNLSEHWTLHTETGAAARSADVIYSIER